MDSNIPKDKSTNNPEITPLVANQYPKELRDDELFINVLNGTKQMQTNQVLTLKKIMRLTHKGKIYWDLTTPTVAGSDVKGWVDQELLPIKHVGKTPDNSRLYQLV